MCVMPVYEMHARHTLTSYINLQATCLVTFMAERLR